MMTPAGALRSSLSSVMVDVAVDIGGLWKNISKVRQSLVWKVGNSLTAGVKRLPPVSR